MIKFIAPLFAQAFSEVEKLVKENKRKFTVIPKDMRVGVEKLGTISFFKNAFAKAEEKSLDRSELASIANEDLRPEHYQRQPINIKRDIDEQFKTEVTRPLVVYFKDLRKRYVLTNKYALTYNFHLKSRNSMEVLEIEC